jgi:hypothetical protein
MVKFLAFSAAFVAVLAGCAATNPNVPVSKAADATTTYLEAKRQYVSKLQTALRGGGDQSASAYRLIAVTGPQWRIGEVVDADDPINLVTEKCVFGVEKLPKPTSWASYPGLTSSSKIDFSAGLPQSVLKVLGKDNKVGLNFLKDNTGVFRLEDMQSVIVAQDTFEAGLTPECKDVLALRGGLVVRGIVTAKEVFSSKVNFDTGADLKILEEQIFKLKYTASGDFSLEDKSASPKMFMVAFFPKKTMGGNSVPQPPSEAQLSRLLATLVSVN